MEGHGITDREYLLLSDALRTEGLNDETIHYNAEQMTGAEFDRLNRFVNWMIENGMTIGRSNYRVVFENFLDGRDGCPSCDAPDYNKHCWKCGYHPNMF